MFHVGNVWIGPWANFAQYMDSTLASAKGRHIVDYVTIAIGYNENVNNRNPVNSK